MALGNVKLGLDDATAYTTPGLPFLTSSLINHGQILPIEFGYVSNFVTVKNSSTGSNTLSVGFSRDGLLPAEGHFFTLTAGESFTGDWRTKEIYLSGSGPGQGSFQLMVGITMIRRNQFPKLTGTLAANLTGTYGYIGV